MKTLAALGFGVFSFAIVALPLWGGWWLDRKRKRENVREVHTDPNAFFTRDRIPVIPGITIDPVKPSRLAAYAARFRYPLSPTRTGVFVAPRHTEPVAALSPAEPTVELAELVEETEAERLFRADPLGSWLYPPEENAPHFLPEADQTFRMLIESGWGAHAAEDIDVEWEAWNLYDAEAVPA